MSVLTGHCGIVLVVRDGVYRRRTWGEKSHRRCPGTLAGHDCSCPCHAGQQPWSTTGAVEHRAVVLGPSASVRPEKDVSILMAEALADLDGVTLDGGTDD